MLIIGDCWLMGSAAAQAQVRGERIERGQARCVCVCVCVSMCTFGDQTFLLRWRLKGSDQRGRWELQVQVIRAVYMPARSACVHACVQMYRLDGGLALVTKSKCDREWQSWKRGADRVRVKAEGRARGGGERGFACSLMRAMLAPVTS